METGKYTFNRTIIECKPTASAVGDIYIFFTFNRTIIECKLY